MKKYLIIILMLLFSIAIPLNVTSQQDGFIRVYGNASSNGDSLDDVKITIINKEDNLKWVTQTDSNGSYEIFVPAKNNDEIIVKAEHNSKEKERSFIVQSSIKSYEVNFEFDEPTIIKVISDSLGFIGSLDLFSLIFVFVIFLLLILVCVSWVHHRRYYYGNNPRNRKYNKD